MVGDYSSMRNYIKELAALGRLWVAVLEEHLFLFPFSIVSLVQTTNHTGGATQWLCLLWRSGSSPESAFKTMPDGWVFSGPYLVTAGLLMAQVAS